MLTFQYRRDAERDRAFQSRDHDGVVEELKLKDHINVAFSGSCPTVICYGKINPINILQLCIVHAINSPEVLRTTINL
jgi:hypothetical protein